MTGSAAHRPQPSRQPHPRHSREGWNPGGVSDSNTAPSNYTVIPAKAGIQTESRNKHRTLQPHRHSHEGGNPGGVSESNTAPSNHTVIPTKVGIQAESRKATPHLPTTPSFPRRRESRRSLERNTALSPPLHRHSHEGGNPGGVSQSNTALSNHTVIPAKAGIQTEPGKKHRPLLLPVIPNHFDLPQPSQAQAFSARYLIPSCRLSCTDCRNSSPQRLMSLCCTMANIDRTRDSRSALPRVNPT